MVCLGLCWETYSQDLSGSKSSTISLYSSREFLEDHLKIGQGGTFNPPVTNPEDYTYTLTSVPGVWVGEGEDATYVPKGALYLLHNGSWGTALAKDATWTQEDINQGRLRYDAIGTGLADEDVLTFKFSCNRPAKTNGEDDAGWDSGEQTFTITIGAEPAFVAQWDGAAWPASKPSVDYVYNDNTAQKIVSKVSLTEADLMVAGMSITLNNASSGDRLIDNLSGNAMVTKYGITNGSSVANIIELSGVAPISVYNTILGNIEYIKNSCDGHFNTGRNIDIKALRFASETPDRLARVGLRNYAKPTFSSAALTFSVSQGGDLLSEVISAVDHCGGATTYLSVDGTLPEWLHFDANTGTLKGFAGTGVSSTAFDIRCSYLSDDNFNNSKTYSVVTVNVNVASGASGYELTVSNGQPVEVVHFEPTTVGTLSMTTNTAFAANTTYTLTLPQHYYFVSAPTIDVEKITSNISTGSSNVLEIKAASDFSATGITTIQLSNMRVAYSKNGPNLDQPIAPMFTLKDASTNVLPLDQNVSIFRKTANAYLSVSKSPICTQEIPQIKVDMIGRGDAYSVDLIPLTEGSTEVVEMKDFSATGLLSFDKKTAGSYRFDVFYGNGEYRTKINTTVNYPLEVNAGPPIDLLGSNFNVNFSENNKVEIFAAPFFSIPAGTDLDQYIFFAENEGDNKVIFENGKYYLEVDPNEVSNGQKFKINYYIGDKDPDNSCDVNNSFEIEAQKFLVANNYICLVGTGGSGLVKRGVTEAEKEAISIVSFNTDIVEGWVRTWFSHYGPSYRLTTADRDYLLGRLISYVNYSYTWGRMRESLKKGFYISNGDLYYDYNLASTTFNNTLLYWFWGYLKVNTTSEYRYYYNYYSSTTPPSTPSYTDPYYHASVRMYSAYTSPFNTEKGMDFSYRLDGQTLNLTIGEDIEGATDFSSIQNSYCSSTTGAKWNFHPFMDDIRITTKVGNKPYTIASPATSAPNGLQSYDLDFSEIATDYFEGTTTKSIELKLELLYNQGGCDDIEFTKTIYITRGDPSPSIIYNDRIYASNGASPVNLVYCKGESNLELAIYEPAVQEYLWSSDNWGTNSATLNASDPITYQPGTNNPNLLVKYASGCDALNNRPQLEISFQESNDASLDPLETDYPFEITSAQDGYDLNEIISPLLQADTNLDPDHVHIRIQNSEYNMDTVIRSDEAEFSNFVPEKPGKYQFSIIHEVAQTDEGSSKGGDSSFFCEFEGEEATLSLALKPTLTLPGHLLLCEGDNEINLSNLVDRIYPTTAYTGSSGAFEYFFRKKGETNWQKMTSEVLNQTTAGVPGIEFGIYEVQVKYEEGQGLDASVLSESNILEISKSEVAIEVTENLAENYCYFTVAANFRANLSINNQAVAFEADYLSVGLFKDGEAFPVGLLQGAADNEWALAEDLPAGNYELKFSLKEEFFKRNDLPDCNLLKTYSFSIFDNPTAQLVEFDKEFCEYDQPVDLNPLGIDTNGLAANLTLDNTNYQIFSGSNEGGPEVVSQRIFTQRTEKGATLNLDSAGVFRVVFQYTDANTCTATAEATVQVNGKPIPSFTVDTLACLNDGGAFEFESNSAMEAGLDAQFGQISSYLWSFGDNIIIAGAQGEALSAEDQQTNTSGFYHQPTHTYSRARQYEVNMTAITDKGCLAAFKDNIELGANPVVNFSTHQFTSGQPTILKEAVGFEVDHDREVDSLYIVFDQAQAGPAQEFLYDGSVEGMAFEHTYPQSGIYEVCLRAKTDIGCDATTSQKIAIFPLVQDTHYHTAFDDAAKVEWFHSGQWDNASDSVSWEWNPSQGLWTTTGGSHGDSLANTNTYNAAENSWIEGPTVDLSLIELPMLELYIKMNTAEGVDGLSLRYSVDEGDSWNTVGEAGFGIDWYTNESVLSLPQDKLNKKQGWSGQDSLYRYARIPLDEVQIQAAPSGQVRFRLWFASNNEVNGSMNYSGVEVKEFTISSRNRLVVAEHFTHEDADPKEADALFDAVSVSPNELVIMQYGFNSFAMPTAYLYETGGWKPSGARALHYSIPEFDRVMVDGHIYERKKWTESAYLQKSISQEKLQKARAFIDDISESDFLDNLDPKTGTTIINVGFETVKNLPIEEEDRRLILHTHMVAGKFELPETGQVFRNIVREMLPDATGLNVKKEEFDENGYVHFQGQVPWQPDAIWAYADEVKMIQTVQGWDTDIIYQARVFDIPQELIPQRPLDAEALAQKLQLYPNPNSGKFTLDWQGEGKADHWALYKADGVRVASGDFQFPARSTQSIEVEDLADGIYVLMLMKEGALLTHKRLVIAH
ncbi:hypothetical protein PEDI_38580 [Persicobacter diffluens]|uniref:PKD domain-containing protein n=1 Tax=Persicobacter diffluens TaxID=981 RepID=A0AAN4W095_9BACT|nr:hypothetical protein PEDI_38580 [Persicobacter diffluens]